MQGVRADIDIPVFILQVSPGCGCRVSEQILIFLYLFYRYPQGADAGCPGRY